MFSNIISYLKKMDKINYIPIFIIILGILSLLLVSRNYPRVTRTVEITGTVAVIAPSSDYDDGYYLVQLNGSPIIVGISQISRIYVPNNITLSIGHTYNLTIDVWSNGWGAYFILTSYNELSDKVEVK